MIKSFEVYYVYYDSLFGSDVHVFKINDDNYVHYLLSYDIHFVSELPF